MNVAVVTASPHNQPDTDMPFIMLLAIPMMD
jgi:hypothetical protein